MNDFIRISETPTEDIVFPLSKRDRKNGRFIFYSHTEGTPKNEAFAVERGIDSPDARIVLKRGEDVLVYDLIVKDNFFEKTAINETAISPMPPIDDALKNQFMTRLLNTIENETFVPGYSTNAEAFVKSELEKNKFRTHSFINSVYISHFKHPRILCAILHILSHLDYDIIAPVGPTIALASLSHHDIEVRDTAIRAFENWAHPDSVEVLKNLHYSEKWLQDYVEQVIEDLEEELNANALSGPEILQGKVVKP